MTRNRIALHIGLTALPILASLGITALLVLPFGQNPLEVFQTIWKGAFSNSNSVANATNFWIPLTLAALGLVVTFTAGLWNIGVEGQMMMGALGASWAAQFIVLPSILLIPVELIAAMIAGMLWALLVGFLKTRLGVHEIFGGVALNALANVFAIFLISGPWQPEIGGSAQGTEPFADYALLSELSSEFPVNLLMLIVTGVAIIGVILALRGTRWGLQLKATGKNARSALLLGVPTEFSAWSALVVCGGLAGLGGSYRVLFTFDNMRPLVSGGIGFLGLLVVLLVSIRALLVPFVAFIFAAMLVGSSRLRMALQLDQSVAGVLQGTIVLLVLLSNGLRERLLERPPSMPPDTDTDSSKFQPTETEAVVHE
jgi:simple sugar transport system permease protein